MTYRKKLEKKLYKVFPGMAITVPDIIGRHLCPREIFGGNAPKYNDCERDPDECRRCWKQKIKND